MAKFVKYAAMGAAGVAGGTFVAYLALVLVFRPVSGGGFDRVLWATVTIAMIVPVAVLAGAHLAFAKQLKDGATSMPR
jgi:Ni/Fe-hydrogenase subunit HybB-like protein